MIRFFKVFLFLLLVLLFAAPIGATPLPWLDFGGAFKWDPAGKLYTDLSARVYFIAYNDFTFSPPSVDLINDSPVTLDISFDGDNSNDIFEIGGWFTADIVIVSNNFDPIAKDPNPYVAYLDNISEIGPPNVGSRWWDEFSDTLDPNNQYDAQLLLSFMAVSPTPLSDGTYGINGNGKVAPVPEPATMLLLGTGLIGLAGIGRKKFKKK